MKIQMPIPKIQDHGVDDGRQVVRVVIVRVILRLMLPPHHGLQRIGCDAGRAGCFPVGHAAKGS
eukprot:1228731-Ditylum_brightwellii.AAC.1